MSTSPDRLSPLEHLIRWCMHNRLLVCLGVVLAVFWGLMVAPFDWDILGLPRDPVPVDAIPDLGENQQIVFTEWPGRSPQDIEDQITYPLTVSLMGMPGIKSVRSQSMFGFSSIYVIFKDDIDFYWSRSRILEKLNSLPPDTLPEGVSPTLGPDATALGQVFWYTLEGRDPEGNPVGGWEIQELRSLQDWSVRYALLAAEGISEIASVGGFVREYQIDVDPDAMRFYDIKLSEIYRAIQRSNTEIGARTIEMNNVEYVVRGLGFLENLEDIENSVIKSRENVPVRIRDLATVSLGPALRRGVLDKEGVEAVGGVAVVRYGANPLEVIKHLKDKIEEVSPGLPAKPVVLWDTTDRATVEAFAAEQGIIAFENGVLNEIPWMNWLRSHDRSAWPEWITTSQVTIVPFYDRTGLIHETLGTLQEAITLQILITILVVMVMLMHLRSSLIISATLPLAVLLSFIGMKLFRVEANIVALSGIAIAIGTIVDMGVILCENILRRLREASPENDRSEIVFQASREVGGAVVTAVATTIIGFLPVFTMRGAEGKMFVPLAYTKTFALIASIIVALTVIPVLARVVLTVGTNKAKPIKANKKKRIPLSWSWNIIAIVVIAIALTQRWLPLGAEKSLLVNFLFVALILGALLGSFLLFQRFYPRMLAWCLRHKAIYLIFPVLTVILGLCIWIGADKVFGFLPERATQTKTYSRLYHAFPGLGKEFMPPLDEGSFLYMPTTMPHASIGEALEVLQYQDRAFAAIPEIETVVGKIGRVESAMDPAPVSMVETLINYKPEYRLDANGRRLRFAYDPITDEFKRDANGNLIPDTRGRPFRQWRDHIKSPDDIWAEILKAGEIPGTTSAPMLQPIMTRLVMLQSGMRAPIGIKVKGPDLETIEAVGIQLEHLLQDVPGVHAPTVFAERIVGKPYLEIDIDREAMGRYGLQMRDVHDVIEVAVGGKRITTTVEGRERYPVRIRYQRELRDQIESLERILVPTPAGQQIPLIQLAEIHFVRGPQMIKGEDAQLVGYVTFDKEAGYAETDVVEACEAYLETKRTAGVFHLPAGVSYSFAGNYEHQVRAQKTLMIVLPVALFIIFMILFLQFRSVLTTALVFTAITVAWGGGFLLLWLYGQDWFLDFNFAGTSLRDLFQVHPIMLSVAVWVGFLALFGIATDDGVVMATYLQQRFKADRPDSVEAIRQTVLEAGKRRIRPCLMTTATTILALLPVLTSTGRGAEVMIPMAIPSFGGMLIEVMTLFLVPVLYCSVQEWKLRWHRNR